MTAGAWRNFQTLENLWTWLGRKFEHLIAVKSEDAETVRVGRLFNILMLSSLGIVTALSLLFLEVIALGLMPPENGWIAIAFPLIFFPIALFCVVRSRLGQVRPMAFFYVWANLGAISLAIWLFDGIYSPGWPLYIWTITIAGILLAPARALWMTAGVVGYFLLLLGATQSGLYTPMLSFGAGRDLVVIVDVLIMLVFTVGWLTYLNMRSLQEALGALGESEKKFRAIAESSLDAIIMIDSRGHVILWNQAAKRILGYSTEEAIGKAVHEWIVPPRYREDARLGLKEFAATGRGSVVGKTLELAALRKDGVEIPIELSVAPIHVGGEWRAVATVRDITERKNAESALRRAALYTRSLIEASVDSVVVADAEGKVTDVNEAGVRATGAPRESIIGTEMFAYVTEPAKARAAFEEVYQKGVATDVLLDVRHRSGKTTHFLFNGALCRDEKGEVIGVVINGRDITELKRTEAALVRLSRMNELLLSSAGEGIYGVDADGRCTFINPAALNMLGLEKTEVLGADPHQLFHSHHDDGRRYPQEECPLFLTLQDGIRRNQEDMFIRKNGEPLLVQMTATPILEDGQITGAEVVFQDIGPRKATEAELVRLATTDPLTGAANRRSFLEQMETEVARVKRYVSRAAVAMVDIDHFKSVNDAFGHSTGDMVIKHLVKLAAKRLRRVDLFARVGGEEFAILLPETDGPGAFEFADQFRRVVAEAPMPSDKGAIPITVSIGVAEFDPRDISSDNILARADKALYRAKETGRNRVELEPLPP